MGKLFFVPQPPFSKTFNLLVDEMSNSKNYGETDDIDKINYNLKLLGENFVNDFKIDLLMVEKGLTQITIAGNYITIIEMSADQKKGQMRFFDCITDMSKNELREMLGGVYSDFTVDEIILFFEKTQSTFSEENDYVSLYIPD